MDLSIFKNTLGQKAFDALMVFDSFIDINYNMNQLFNEKNELKYQRNKKTLVAFYIEEDKLRALIIFGKKEREVFEEKSTEFSEYINNYYYNSKIYHDGKWMFIDIYDDTYAKDIINMIRIKKKPDPNAVTMCGYKCDLCKAYSKNIKKEDKREELSDVWHKYYGFKVESKNIYCDGCRSKKKDAKLIDKGCPVRMCVIGKQINSCIECEEYSCDKFAKRTGLSACGAKAALKEQYSIIEYEKFLLAYDNKSRIDNYLKYKNKYDITLS